MWHQYTLAAASMQSASAAGHTPCGARHERRQEFGGKKTQELPVYMRQPEEGSYPSCYSTDSVGNQSARTHTNTPHPVPLTLAAHVASAQKVSAKPSSAAQQARDGVRQTPVRVKAINRHRGAPQPAQPLIVDIRGTVPLLLLCQEHDAATAAPGQKQSTSKTSISQRLLNTSNRGGAKRLCTCMHAEEAPRCLRGDGHSATQPPCWATDSPQASRLAAYAKSREHSRESC